MSIEWEGLFTPEADDFAMLARTDSNALGTPRFATPHTAHIVVRSRSSGCDMIAKPSNFQDPANFLDDDEMERVHRDLGTTSDWMPEWLPSPAIAIAAPPPAPPAVFANNKRALDARWAHVLDTTAKEMRDYFAAHPELTTRDKAEIRAARRRAANRKYAHDAHMRKKKQRAAGLSGDPAVVAELERLYMRESQLTELLTAHGIPVPPPLAAQ